MSVKMAVRPPERKGDVLRFYLEENGGDIWLNFEYRGDSYAMGCIEHDTGKLFLAVDLPSDAGLALDKTGRIVTTRELR